MPPPFACWLVGCLLFGFLKVPFSLNIVAGAGSLFFGCYFQVIVFHAVVISKADAVVLGAQNCNLAALVFAFNGHQFGTLGAPWQAMGAAEKAPWDPKPDVYLFLAGCRIPF